MDQFRWIHRAGSLGEGGLNGGFASPSSHSSAPRGLSKPRLAKQRKPAAAARARSAAPAAPEGGVILGFNPFRGEGGGTRVLDEKLRAWSPFDSTGGSGAVGGGDGSRSGSFESVKSENAGFVFGGGSNSGRNESEAGLKSDSGLSSSSGGNENEKSEYKTFVLGAGRTAGSFPNLNTSDTLLGSGVSVFGSIVNESSNLGQSSSATFDGSTVDPLPDEMRKLNIEGYGNQVGPENANSADCSNSKIDHMGVSVSGESLASMLPDEMRKLNIRKSGCDEQAEGPDYIRPKDERKSSPALVDDAYVFGQSTSNIVGLEKSKGADHSSSEADSRSTFVWGSRKNSVDSFPGDTLNKLPEEIKKLNIGSEPSKDLDADASVFESSSGKTQVPPWSMANNLQKNTGAKLPDDTPKFNIGVETSASVFSGSTTRSVSEGKTGVSALNEKPSSEKVSDNLLGGLNKDFHVNDFTTKNFDLYQSASQAGMPDNRSSAGNAHSTNSSYHFVPSGPMENPSYPSSVGSGFASATTDFTFMSSREAAGTSHMDYRTPMRGASVSSQENVFSAMRQNFAFSVKKGVPRDARSKKRSGKMRKPVQDHLKKGNVFIPREGSSHESPELTSPGSCSPMDFSPYQETLASEQCSRETSVASDESGPFDSHITSNDTQQPFSVEAMEGLVSSAKNLVITESDMKSLELNEDTVKEDVETYVDARSSFLEEQDFDPGERDQTYSTENVNVDRRLNNDPTEPKTGSFSSSIEKQVGDAGPDFTFCSSLDDVNVKQSNFTFGATSSTQGAVSSSKRPPRKKNQTKTNQNSYNSSLSAKFPLPSSHMNLFPLSSISMQTDPTSKHAPEGAPVVLQSGERITEGSLEAEVKQESAASTPASLAAQEACENWRLRGNQAYAKENLSKAEEYYTYGVNCVSPNENSTSCTRALMLCYSNRAATRMSLGRMREAISDCMMAVAIDPNFLKAQVRAANCHLALGETEKASKLFKKCVELVNRGSLDTKILSEASDGLEKAQQVADCIGRSAELLQKRTCTDARNALQIVSEASVISPYSESLTQMKAKALLLLRRYDEVVELCERTMDSSEINSSIVSVNDQKKDGEFENMQSSQKIWRWQLISKSYFYMGRLEEALDLLQKHELVGPLVEKSGSKSLQSLASFAVTLQDLLRLKAAGNTAFQAGRYLEAVEHYTASVASSLESRPFAAICFSNRAGAYQALGQITDAIADCSLAIALDTNYPKAISRRAALYEMIRDYSQATNDLSRLIMHIERQSEDKPNHSGTVGRSISNGNDLKRARTRLATMEEEARKGIPLNMYLILGIESSSSAADIKKAYRKAALKHHPDKAGQLLVKSENSDDAVWKDVADEVHRDADRLFKMIGEAYAVLSDPAQRMQYDAEEEMRTIFKKGENEKNYGDVHSSRFDRSDYRRQHQNFWNSYGSSQQRWSEFSQSSRYF